MSRYARSITRWSARLAALLIAVGFVGFAIGEPPAPLSIITPREWVGMVLLFGAVATMVLAWKWELPAALISLFALGAFAAIAHLRRFDVLMIAAIPDLLFLVDWKLRHPHSRSFRQPGENRPRVATGGS